MLPSQASFDVVGSLGAKREGAKTLGPPGFGRGLAVNVVELVCVATSPDDPRHRETSRHLVGAVVDEQKRSDHPLSALPSQV